MLKGDLHKALSEIIRAKSDAEALNYANKFAKEMLQTFFEQQQKYILKMNEKSADLVHKLFNLLHSINPFNSYKTDNPQIAKLLAILSKLLASVVAKFNYHEPSSDAGQQLIGNINEAIKAKEAAIKTEEVV